MVFITLFAVRELKVRKLDKLKGDLNKVGLSIKEIEWLFFRIEKLESAIQFHMKNVPAVTLQKNNANLHFILVDRLKAALEEE